MDLEDAKLLKQDMCALIVDFTSAFYTTDHDRKLWIMYDLGFPTDTIEVVKNLNQNATTLVRQPKEDTKTKFLSREGQYKEILCPLFCSSCTWNHSSGGFKWEDVGIAMSASKIPVLKT